VEQRWQKNVDNMADIELLIDIPMNAYDNLIKYGYKNLGSFDCGNILKAVTNGIPLQKIKDEIEQIGAYYQEVGEQERANAFLEVLSIIDKCKVEKECKHCEYFDLSTNKCLITGEKCYENKECLPQGCQNYKKGEWCSN
jgi:hypothetical protein